MKTIYSLVTKPINQNIAVIRISGSETFEVIKKIFSTFNPKGNSVNFYKLFIDKTFVDDVLLLTFVSPNSFTGEDVVEIQSHGSMFVVEKILSKLNSFGLTQSEPGAFMKQAYMNGKIDLTQSEAINTLIVSENKELSKLSSKNINGNQRTFIDELLKRLGEIVSNIQISIDYPENTDLEKYDPNNIKKEIIKFKNDLSKIIDDSKKLIKFSKGIVISIIGFPNVGKSTLLNSLSKENKAIVSDIEGTTRDVIESTMYIDGIKITFQDTAGIRKESKDTIEKEGIKRSYEAMERADIILKILDGTKDISKQINFFSEVDSNYKNKVIEVFSKSDLLKKEKNKIYISAINNDINPLLNSIKDFIKKNIFDSQNNNALLITNNQVTNFNVVFENLSNAINMIEKNEAIDIVAFELEITMKKLGLIIGKEIDQDYMAKHFANFCVGK